MNIQTFHQTYIEGQRNGTLDLALRGLCQQHSSALSDKPVDFDWFVARTDATSETTALGWVPWTGISHARAPSPSVS